jgi:type IV secretion system protein VirD4
VTRRARLILLSLACLAPVGKLLYLLETKALVSRETGVPARQAWAMILLQTDYEKGRSIGKSIVEFFSALLPGWVLLLLIVMVVLSVLGILTRIFMSGDPPPGPPPPEPPGPPPLTTNYGSADYADVETEYPDSDVVRHGVFFGKSSKFNYGSLQYDTGAPVFSRPESHCLVIGKTRVGKGTRIIIPTLACYMDSMLVIDPKGENAAVTANLRRLNKQTVHILNPWGELSSTFNKLKFPPATFNPLDMLDRNDPNAVAIAQGLAGAICPRDPGAKDSFWTESAASLLTAVLLWLTDQPGETKTLARAREIVTKSRQELVQKYVVKMAASTAYGGAIAENASQFVDMAAETYSGVVSNLNRFTRFLSDPQVKASTASSSFSMSDLALKPTTVYVVIPPDRIDTQRTWLRLLIAAGMHTFKRVPMHQRKGRRCMFLIDEFPALGHLEDVPRDIATMSGYGLDFTLIIQGLDQLKAAYGESSQTIINNCAYKWFCGVNDLNTAKYLSESLGKKTVRTTGKSASEGSSGMRGTENEGTTWGETGRALMTPDEVMNLGRDWAILLNPYTRPHYLRPIDYWLFERCFKSLMYIRLFFDDNPYHTKKPVARA